MKTYTEIKIELQRDNEHYKLAQMLIEMTPIQRTSFGADVLRKAAKELRKFGDQGIHVEACFVMDKQRNPVDEDGTPLPGSVVLHKEQ